MKTQKCPLTPETKNSFEEFLSFYNTSWNNSNFKSSFSDTRNSLHCSIIVKQFYKNYFKSPSKFKIIICDFNVL